MAVWIHINSITVLSLEFPTPAGTSAGYQLDQTNTTIICSHQPSTSITVISLWYTPLIQVCTLHIHILICLTWSCCTCYSPRVAQRIAIPVIPAPLASGTSKGLPRLHWSTNTLFPIYFLCTALFILFALLVDESLYSHWSVSGDIFGCFCQICCSAGHLRWRVILSFWLHLLNTSASSGFLIYWVWLAILQCISKIFGHHILVIPQSTCQRHYSSTPHGRQSDSSLQPFVLSPTDFLSRSNRS